MKKMTKLRDYQIEICERVREAFKKHRSVMMQMPTGTGKTVVLAELVRQFLHDNTNRTVVIVAHRRELVEQIQQTLIKVLSFENSPVPSYPKEGLHLSPKSSLLRREDLKPGRLGLYKQTSLRPQGVARELPTQYNCDCLCAEGAAAHIEVQSIQWLSQNNNKVLKKPDLVIVDEAHHAVAKTYRQLWDAWPEARFLGLTATPYRLSGEGFTDLFDVLVDSWTVKRFIAEGWLSAFDYYSIRPESDDQKLIDNLKKRGADGDFQMKELHETLDVAPCIERLFESFERFAYDKKGIVYAIDIAHAEHIAEYYRQQGVTAYAISSKTPIPERKRVIEAFRNSSFCENSRDTSLPFFENHPPSPSLPLKKGLHLSPKSSPLRGEDLKPGRLGLYEQTSSRPVGVARELPTQQSCDCLCAKGAAAHSIQVLVSVDLFSEGFDCPDVEFIQMARPTLSLAKYLQMVGRGLRTHEGKECCTIIDNVGLYRRFGLPSGERNWRMYFGGLKDERMKELNNLDFGLNHNSGSVREEGDAALVKIVGHEGMASRFDRLGRAGFERKKKAVLLSGKRKKAWVWVDTLTGITFERHPVAVDFKGVEMMTDDGLTFYPRIRSKWVDGKSGINRKALETQVGDGFGWTKCYVSLREPDKVYELQEVMAGGMRVYKDEEGKTYFQQDLDCPLVSEDEAGGKKAFMALCEKRQEEWKTKVWERRRNGFLHADVTTGEWELHGKQAEKDGEFFRIVESDQWFDGNTGFVYHHRPVVRYRGFVKLVYDGDLVYIMNIHEERFIAYHNWEIRADDGICTIGNKLYLKRNKDGKALWINKRSGDFQIFVVNEPMMVKDAQKRPLTIDVLTMIINKYGKEVEKKQIKRKVYDD